MLTDPVGRHVKAEYTFSSSWCTKDINLPLCLAYNDWDCMTIQQIKQRNRLTWGVLTEAVRADFVGPGAHDESLHSILGKHRIVLSATCFLYDSDRLNIDFRVTVLVLYLWAR